MTADARCGYGEYSPAEVLHHARRLVSPEGQVRGFYTFSTKFSLRLDEVGLAPEDGDAIHEAVQRLVHEAQPGDFRPMRRPFREDPGYGFVFNSSSLGRRVYFKIRLAGRRPRIEICSLHRPDWVH